MENRSTLIIDKERILKKVNKLFQKTISKKRCLKYNNLKDLTIHLINLLKKNSRQFKQKSNFIYIKF